MKTIVRCRCLALLLLFSLLPIDVRSEDIDIVEQSCLIREFEFEILPFIDEGCHGRNQTWDFSKAYKNISPQARKMVLYQRGDTISCDCSGKLIVLLQTNDTIQVNQIETPSSLICYNSPIPILSFPLTFGEQISAPFAGTGNYEGKLDIKESGQSYVSVDGTGTLILEEGDTLYNTVRVHRCLSSDIRISENQSPDEILNVHKTNNTYEWFLASSRLPVFVIQEEITTCGEHPLQESRYACKIPSLVILGNEEESIEGDGNPLTHNAINHFSTKNLGSNVEVEYTVSQSILVHIILSDCSGVVYFHAVYNETKGDVCTHEIPLQGLRRGQYIVYANTDGETNALVISVN